MRTEGSFPLVSSVHHPGLEGREFPFILRPAATYRNNEDKLRRGEERQMDTEGEAGQKPRNK